MRHVFTPLLFTCLLFGDLALDTLAAQDARVQLAGWIKESGGDAAQLAAWPELQVDGASVFRTLDAIYVQLGGWPTSHQIALPRLNNPTQSVFLLGKPDEELKLTPEPSRWVVRLPETQPAGTRAVVVIKTIGEPHIPRQPQRIAADEQGGFTLPAHRAVTHGEMLRYEPQPHKNTVGYWTKATDWVAWHLDVKRPGKYVLHILQGCGKGQGGSEVGIHLRPDTPASEASDTVPAADLQFVVQDTGHFQNFVPRELGVVEFPKPGAYRLEIRPTRLARNAVMDVREVRLVPGGDN